MKAKADGWLFVFAALAVAAVLFMPLPVQEPALSLPQTLKPLVIVPALAWLLAAAAFWGFRIRFWAGDARERRRLSHAVMLLLIQALLLRTIFELALAYRQLVPWPWLPKAGWVWMPWFLIPGLTGILLGRRFGILSCLASFLMLYLLAEPGPWPLIGCLASSVTGILLLRRSPTRSRVLRAGSGTGATLGLVAAVHYAMRGAPVDAVSAGFLVPLLIGVFSAFVVLAVLPVLEWLLGELSDVRLIEYGTDHPLLDRLRAEAPGTWHHSLNVADLAEKAAAAVGARALFCKTAALYHDIGKLKEPALFAENNDGVSVHDQLDPQVSARRIIEHVPHGIELARKHRLPQAFREIIAEHHGLSVVRFFYGKACHPLPDGTQPVVDRALFAYPGPPPSTRESGIIALSDAVEAASRSIQLRAESEWRAFVRKLLSDRISEGELSFCPLTLADLGKIENSFVVWLKGRNQYRPAYPEPATETDTAIIPPPEKLGARQPA